MNSRTHTLVKLGVGIALASIPFDPSGPSAQSVQQGPLGGAQQAQRTALPKPPPPAPMLGAHPVVTSAATVQLTGTALESDAVEIAAPAGTFVEPLQGTAFTVDVPLVANSVNSIYVRALGQGGQESAPATTQVTQDSAPPDVFIDFPLNGAELSVTSVDIAGRVGDVLSGFMNLTVAVNGIQAVVDVGIGTNGTFYATGVPIAPDAATTITAVAADMLGNTASTEIQVMHATPTGPQMGVVSGSGQSAPVTTELPGPLVVQMFQADGVTPFVGKLVTFDVTRSDGRLSASPGGPGSIEITLATDRNGEAQVYWTLGTDAGCGNNRVEVRSTSIAGSVFFHASATPGPAAFINVTAGERQRVETFAPAPEPLRAWVNDGCNGIAGVAVTFTVVSGGGLVDGLPSAIAITDPTGHAEVLFELGAAHGNQAVEATFAQNTGSPATFTAYGIPRTPGAPTSFQGLVLDNARRPIGGAECSLVLGATTLVTTTDTLGLFEFPDVPASGPGELVVDGLLATWLAGDPIPVASFPALHFPIVVVPEAANALPTPALLPLLDPVNAVVFDNTQDAVLTVAGIAGLEMTVMAGSLTLADGSVPDAQVPALVSLNLVQFEDIPMPMPNGATPPYAWTLQPSGATFDPPVTVSMPNANGLPPGAIVYFLSFDHDTNRFEIVGSGAVTDDGSTVVSDPGSGITKAGWGGNCPPYVPGGNGGSGGNPPCDVQILTGPTVACIGEDLTFTAQSLAGGTLFWAGGEVPPVGAGASFTTRFTTPGAKTILVSASCAGGSSAVDTRVVQVFDVLADVNGTAVDQDDFVVVTDPATPNRPFTELELTLDGSVPVQVDLISNGPGFVSFSDPSPVLTPLVPLTVEVYGDLASLAENDTVIEVVPVGGATPCAVEDLTVVTGIKVRYSGNFLFMIENNNGSVASNSGLPFTPCNGDPDPLVWQNTPLPVEGLDADFFKVFFEEGLAANERWTLASGLRPMIGVYVSGVKTFGPEVDLDGRDPLLQTGTPVQSPSAVSGQVAFIVADSCLNCPSTDDGKEDGVEPILNFAVRFGDTFGLAYAPGASGRIWTEFPTPLPTDAADDYFDIDNVFFPGAGSGPVEPSSTYFDDLNQFQCQQPLSLEQLFRNGASFRSFVRRAWANWTSRGQVVTQEAQFASSFISQLFEGAVRGNPANNNADPTDDVYAEAFMQLTDYDWYTLCGQVSKGVAATPGGVDPIFIEWPGTLPNPPTITCLDGTTIVPSHCPNPYQPNVPVTADPW